MIKACLIYRGMNREKCPYHGLVIVGHMIAKTIDHPPDYEKEVLFL
jgi:hypothetical protein